jgi:sporulation protein YlmC with PRC-barrel domain
MDSNIANSSSLIEGSRVKGVAVYNPKAERLGTVDDVVIDKRSGKVVYAVMSFGGFLGIGNDYYPIPWGKLKYEPSLQAYVADINAKILEGAPNYAEDTQPKWDDPNYEEGIHTHYGIAPYWGSSWI